MTKTAAIVTLGYKSMIANNGGFLQHYALRRVLSCQFGLRVFRVDVGLLSQSGRNFLCGWMAIPLRGIWRCLSGKWHQGVMDIYLFVGRLRFWYDYRRLIGPLFERQILKPDYAIVGSDQVWNIPHSWSPDPFLLRYGDDTCKFSYAASADWDACYDNQDWRDSVRRAGERFRGVSVREERGRELCLRLFGSSCVPIHVVDPTLLLQQSEYEEIIPAKPIFNRPTLFCYLVNVVLREGLNFEAIKECAARLSCDLKVISLIGAGDAVPRENRMLPPPSPTDFLRCYRDAKYVITNTFHGTAFAVRFKKNFAFNCQLEWRNWHGRNLRQEDFLKSIGLEDRILPTVVSAEEYLSVFARVPDWDSAYAKLEERRSFSLKWLRRMTNSSASVGNGDASNVL